MNSFPLVFKLLAAAPPAESAAAVEVQSIWDFVLKGGFMMIPIGVCSLVALAVVIERVVSLRRDAVIPSSFLKGLKKVLSENPGDRELSLAYCRRNPSPLASVFTAGIKRLGHPMEAMEKHIEEAGEREVLKLRRGVRLLSVVAAITPLMGLLGTIFGMIKAFQTVAMSAESLGKAELLAEGIYEAMITTAAGLSVAIPVLVLYHWISAKIEKLVLEIDLMTSDFVEEYGSDAISLPSEPERGPQHTPVTKTTKPDVGAVSSPPPPRLETEDLDLRDETKQKGAA